MIVQAIKKNDTTSSKLNYMLKLVLRSFMIAAIVFFAVLMIFIFICRGDSYSSKNLNNTTYPLLGAYIIVSESMVPTIEVNDAIIVKRVDDDDLKIGDIITFSSNDHIYKGLTVTHRIIGIQENSAGTYVYRTKGDNNILADTALVNLDNVYGKVILKIPKLGYLQKFVSSTTGFILAIVFPIIAVIIYEVVRIRKLLKQQDEELEII